MSKKQPPKWATKFLLAFLKEELAEEVLGDLEEKFYSQLSRYSHRKARRNYWFQVLHYMRPFALKYFKSKLIFFIMLKQDTQLFIRRLFRNKADSLISLGSITLGLTAVLLAFTFIWDERGFDAFHSKEDRIFRLNKVLSEPSGERSKNAETPGQMAMALEEDFPEVEVATHIFPWFDEVLATYEEGSIQINNWVFADEKFFQIFDFKVLNGGQPTSLLSQPGKVLITPSIAKGLFGDENPIGKSFMGLSDKMYTVAGIIEEAPRRSHIQFDVITSWASTTGDSGFLDFSFMNNWLGQTVYTYALLNSPDQMEAVNGKLPAFTARHMPDRIEMYDFYLQPLSEIYLQSSDLRYLRGGKYGSAPFLRTFSIIAVLILLIACFNYINITTARSLQRAKEVGVKKILGAQNGSIVQQFLTETLLMTTLAALLACIFAWILLPQINLWFQKDIPVSNLLQPLSIGFLVLIILITSFISGLFPGVLLSKFRPISVLKNTFRLSPAGRMPRQVLTTLQLSVGIGLIAGTLLLNQQFRYLLNRDLGFDKDQVMVMNTPPGVKKNLAAFREELNALAGIQSVSICQAAMGEGSFTTTVIPEGNNNEELPAVLFRIDSVYLQTYGINIVEGRPLNRTSDIQSPGLLVNESFLKQMGWAKGTDKTIQFPGTETRFPIHGVVKDFHYNSLHEQVDPIVMYLDNRNNNVSVRLNTELISGLLPKMEQLWNRFEQRYPFDYYFIDDFFATRYFKEKEMLRIISVFAALAIFIACLGFYGMVAFNIARRKKEIGIRKVLGASLPNVFALLTKNFMLPLILALLLAVPVSLHFLQQWLQNFTYHVSLSWWIFVLSGLLMILIMFLTVSFQTLKAASANPVDSLRDE